MPAPTDIVTRLRAAGCVFAEQEAAVIIDSAADPAEVERFVALREEGLPLEHVVGWAEFCGLRVAVEPGVFVPRPRSERLVRAAAASLAAGDVLLDLCCGSGAVGVALAAAVPGVRVVAADIDQTAVAVARRNLQGVGEVYQGDLFGALPADLRGAAAVLAVVAPYVPTADIELLPHEARDFEPRAALDGGLDGLDVLARVIRGARDWLRPGGLLVTEVAEEQAPRVVALLHAAGLVGAVDTDEDLGSTIVTGRT